MPLSQHAHHAAVHPRLRGEHIFLQVDNDVVNGSTTPEDAKEQFY